MALTKDRKVFTRKPYDKHLYKWTPQTTDKKSVKNKQVRRNGVFCDAKPYTNGEDWVTTYVYELINDNGVQRRYAYVECNYVE